MTSGLSSAGGVHMKGQGSCPFDTRRDPFLGSRRSAVHGGGFLRNGLCRADPSIVLEACRAVSYLDRRVFGLDMTRASSSVKDRIPTIRLVTFGNWPLNGGIVHAKNERER